MRLLFAELGVQGDSENWFCKEKPKTFLMIDEQIMVVEVIEEIIKELHLESYKI